MAPLNLSSILIVYKFAKIAATEDEDKTKETSCFSRPFLSQKIKCPLLFPNAVCVGQKVLF